MWIEKFLPRGVKAPRLTVLVLLAVIAGCGRTPPTFVERAPLKGHTREIVSLAFVGDGKMLVTRAADDIKVWDHDRRIEVSSYGTDGSDFGTVVCAPDVRAFAQDWKGVGAKVSDLTNRREQQSFQYPSLKLGVKNPPEIRGWGLAYSPDGKTLAGGGSHGEDGFLTLWNTATGQGVELAPLRRPITTVAFSPDGKTVASGGMDGKLVLWDPVNRVERLQIEAGRSYLAPVVFSPDGRTVVSTNEARYVKLWDVATGREVGVMKGHIKAVLSLAFAPDGATLVSGDSGGTLFVWDVPSRNMMTRIESSGRGKVWGLAFSPDGKILASCGEDRLVHLWNVIGSSPTGTQ